jgi:hypothetical protein
MAQHMMDTFMMIKNEKYYRFAILYSNALVLKMNKSIYSDPHKRYMIVLNSPYGTYVAKNIREAARFRMIE